MPAKLRPAEFRWKDEEEKARIMAEAAKSGLSFGNWLRVRIGLEPIQHGGKREPKPKAS